MKSIFKLFFVFLFLLKFNIQNVGAAAESGATEFLDKNQVTIYSALSVDHYLSLSQDLLKVVDVKLAEDGLNKINHLLFFLHNSDVKPGVVQYYGELGIAEDGLQEYLTKNAYDAAQPEASLSQCFNTLSNKVKNLQGFVKDLLDLCKKLEIQNKAISERLKEVERQESRIPVEANLLMGQSADLAELDPKEDSNIPEFPPLRQSDAPETEDSQIMNDQAYPSMWVIGGVAFGASIIGGFLGYKLGVWKSP